jgi:outer membrane protein OmpA-like peptidoglycan-associated protein
MFKNLQVKNIVKKTLLAICFLQLLHTAIAQSKFGIVAGTGKNSLYKFSFSPADFNRYSSTNAAWAGITADLSLKKNKLSLFIAPTYNKKGYNYLLQNQTGAISTIKDSNFKQNINYVDVNINLHKKFIFKKNNAFFAGTGPVISFLTGGKEQMQINYFGNTPPSVNITNNQLSTDSSTGKYQSSFFSWGVSAGLEIKNFSIWLSASIPLNPYFKDAQYGVQHKIKTFGINIGYTLYTHHRKNKSKKIKDTLVNIVIIDSLKDTDGDGIVDINDRCPGHKGTLKYFGCPVPDTDGDGINDDEDKCIEAAGIAANNGCPDFIDTITTSAQDSGCYTVYFEPAKSILRTGAYKTLDIIVQQLKANPKLNVVFKGHTDNTGNSAANSRVSFARASACLSYVASYYIDKKRLTIIALGNTAPAADLKDPLLQWKNRRVEICVFEKND